MAFLGMEVKKIISLNSINKCTYYSTITHIFTGMFTPSVLLTTVIVVAILAATIITILIFIKKKKKGEKQNQAKLRRKAMVHLLIIRIQ